MDDKYELIEEYEYGVLVKRTVNGHDFPILDMANCKSVTVVRMMSREAVEKIYGKYFKDGQLDFLKKISDSIHHPCPYGNKDCSTCNSKIRKPLQYKPIYAHYFLVKEYPELQFSKHVAVFEWEPGANLYVPKNVFGEKVRTSEYGYSSYEMGKLLQKGIVNHA